MSDQIRCALKKENNTKQTETRLVVKRKLRFFILFHIFFEKIKYLHFYLAMSAEKWNSFPVMFENVKRTRIHSSRLAVFVSSCLTLIENFFYFLLILFD